MFTSVSATWLHEGTSSSVKVSELVLTLIVDQESVCLNAALPSNLNVTTAASWLDAAFLMSKAHLFLVYLSKQGIFIIVCGCVCMWVWVGEHVCVREDLNLEELQSIASINDSFSSFLPLVKKNLTFTLWMVNYVFKLFRSLSKQRLGQPHTHTHIHIHALSLSLSLRVLSLSLRVLSITSLKGSLMTKSFQRKEEKKSRLKSEKDFNQVLLLSFSNNFEARDEKKIDHCQKISRSKILVFFWYNGPL